jgi:hypothetical protein
VKIELDRSAADRIVNAIKRAERVMREMALGKEQNTDEFLKIIDGLTLASGELQAAVVGALNRTN